MIHPKERKIDATMLEPIGITSTKVRTVYEILKSPDNTLRDHVDGSMGYALAWLIDQTDLQNTKLAQVGIRKCKNCGGK